MGRETNGVAGARASSRSATVIATSVALLVTVIVGIAGSATPATAAVGTFVPSPPALVIPQNTVTAHSAPGVGPVPGAPVNAPFTAAAATPSGSGYWLAASDGGVFSFGDAGFYGSAAATRLNAPIVAIARTRTGRGYWLAASDGGVFAFGDAGFFGSPASFTVTPSIVGVAGTPTGLGYWLVSAAGDVFAFGDAVALGGLTASQHNGAIVGIASTPTGGGYWLVASDGGVFTFGDAAFFGSIAGGAHQPVIGIAPTPAGSGYTLVATDGGVFTFGDAPFAGSDAAAQPSAPVVAFATAATTGGYWLVHGQQFLPAAPGATGLSVTRIQDRLRELGYWIGSEGRYGFLTTQAVYAFQKTNDLPVTGVVDGRTAARLVTATRPRPGAFGDLIEVDKAHQILFVVRSGVVVWAFNTSTGSGLVYSSRGRRAIARTPEGTFRIQREVNHLDRSPLGFLYRPKYFTSAGHAIHGYTSVPAFPASHGCVRVSNAAMDFLWSSGLAPIGLTVWVHA